VITEIEVENVRLFEGSGWKFPLKSLTVFCGTNSAGKSTLIKTLLLLKQSQNQRMGVARPLFSGDNNDSVDLWNYETFVSNGSTSDDISIGISIELTTLWVNLERAFDLKIPEGQTPQDKINYKVKTKFIFKSDPIYPEKDEELDKYGYLHRGEYEIHVNNEIRFSWVVEYDAQLKGNPQSSVYWLLIPKSYLKLVKSQLPKELRKQIKVAQGKEYAKIQVGLDGFFPFLCVFSESENPDEINIFPIQVISQIFNPINNLENVLSSIAHIAPLRQGPQRYYNRSGDLRRLDSNGAFVPRLLHEDGQDIVSYIRPDRNKLNGIRLIDALNDWLYYLRTGDLWSDIYHMPDELSIENTKGFVIEINLRTPSGKSMYPMADSGVGLSQVLPILSRVLIEGDESTILIEQPELHLHPAMQVRLAEFFVCMSGIGKQIIIETHSEHIVNTIRVLAAEDETGEIAKNSQIHFIDIDNAKTRIYNLSIQPNGVVPNWPPSFFGEAMNLTGRLLRAQKRFRNQS